MSALARLATGPSKNVVGRYWPNPVVEGAVALARTVCVEGITCQFILLARRHARAFKNLGNGQQGHSGRQISERRRWIC